MPRSTASKERQRAHTLFCYSGGTISLQNSNSSSVTEEFLRQVIEELSKLTVEDANILCGNNRNRSTVNSLSPIFEDHSTIKCYVKRLHKERERIGLTLEEVGNTFGISGVAIHKKESGSGKKIDPDDLLSFSLLFQVTPHYLVGLVSDPHAYLPTDSVIKALNPDCQSNTPSICDQHKNVTIPMHFPSEAIRIRGQRILYHTLLDNPDLLEVFLHLATSTFTTQKCTIARFRDLYALHETYIDEALSEDFSEAWDEFIFQPDVLKRHQEFSDSLALFETLGTRHFDCLDCLARIACSRSHKFKEMIYTLIYESLRTESNKANCTKENS